MSSRIRSSSTFVRCPCDYTTKRLNGRIFPPRGNANWNFPESRRHFVSSDVVEVWKQTSVRLLEGPKGALNDSKRRKECHTAILWWLRKDHGPEGIQIAFQLLDRVCEDDYDNDTHSVELRNNLPDDSFDTDLLNLVVNRWRQAIAEEPLSILSREELHPGIVLNKIKAIQSMSLKIKPNIQTFTMIIDGASNISTNTKDPSNSGVQIAEDTFDWLLQNATEHPELRPNVFTFSSLMNTWVKSGKREAPERVEELLEHMHELEIEEPDWNVSPNQVTYVTAIDCWAHLGRIDRVEELLKEMHIEYSHGNEDLKPSLHAFNGYLVALAKAGEVDKAELILEQMEELYTSGELDEKPSVISYSTVLSAFANTRINGAAERAESILVRMIDQGISPNAISYNSVINACIKAQKIEVAERYLKEMQESYLEGNLEVRPTLQTYTLVLSGWARTRLPEAGERGEKLLELMKSLARSGELDKPPDIVAYNVALDCWAKSRTRDSVSKAFDLLERMTHDGIAPDVFSYNILMGATNRMGNIRDTESIFHNMRDAGVEPDTTTYNTLLDSWSKSGLNEAPSRMTVLFSELQENENISPDLVTNNIMLHFYSKSGNAQRAESLLDDICQPGSIVQADSVSFNTVISAWSRSRQPDAPQRAEIILNKMLAAGENIRPNSITFNSVMGAWIKSKSSIAYQHCENLFLMMNEVYQDGHRPARPDVVTYNTLIQAWSQSNLEEAPDRAEAIFHEMKRHVTPTAKTYGVMINIWSKSKRRDAGEKAEAYLRDLVEKTTSGEFEDDLRVFEFTSAIRAWLNSGSPKAIYNADEILHLLLGNQDVKPDSKLFEIVLKVLASSSLREKAKYADKILRLMKAYKILPNRTNVELLQICYNERIQQAL